MSGLLNGADCSVNTNPLNNVLKREGVDNSVFRDRVSGAPGSSSQAGAAFRQQHAPAAPGQVQQVPHPFNLSHLSAALSQPGPVQTPVVPAMAPQAHHNMQADWERFRAQSQRGSPQPQLAPAPAQSAWASDFSQGKGKAREMPQQHMEPMMHTPQMMPPNPFGGMGMMQQYQPRLSPMYTQAPPVAADHAKMEAAFEAALADARAQSVPQEKEAEPETKTDEAKTEEAKTEEPKAEEERPFKGDLEAVWESLKPEAERQNKLAEWEAEFSQFVNGENDDFDVLQRELERDDLGQTPLDDQMEFGTGRWMDEGMNESGLPAQVNYVFTTPNRFDSYAPLAAWHEANLLLSNGGSLHDCALLIETFLRRATDNDLRAANVSRAHAWAVLGRTHAENEMEDRALQAFDEGRRALENDPKANQVAGELFTNLAISYVNESLDFAALTTLHQLLAQLHPTHAGQAPSRSEFVSDNNPWAVHQRMTKQYLDLAREQYAKAGVVDPDVQVGLGTLYYMQGEFDEARSCWTAALNERPDDYLLWNRLGATLANGGDPEQAVDAYRRALEIKPTFTRAIANLGVACLNIGVYREAAEHFLAALALQPGNGGTAAPEAYSLWATLRRSLVALEKPELADQARPGTDLNVFRQAGFDF